MTTATPGLLTRDQFALLVEYARLRRRVVRLRRDVRALLAGPDGGLRDAPRRLAEAEEMAAEVRRRLPRPRRPDRR